MVSTYTPKTYFIIFCVLALGAYPLQAQPKILHPAAVSEWNAEAISALKIKTIYNTGTFNRYNFYRHGGLAAYYIYDQNCIDDYRSHDDNTPEPLCYQLWTNPADFDTSQCALLKKWNGNFWTRQVILGTAPVYIFFQVDKAGEVLFMKWAWQNDVTYGRDICYIAQKQTYDENGNVNDVLLYEITGCEWDLGIDTLEYAAYTGNGYGRVLASLKKWNGYPVSDPQLHACYTCFETDSWPGADTCYALSSGVFTNSNRSTMSWYTGAESFKYDLQSKQVMHKRYRTLWDNTYRNAPELDSVYLHSAKTLPMLPVQNRPAKPGHKQLRREINKLEILLADKKYIVEYYNK